MLESGADEKRRLPSKLQHFRGAGARSNRFLTGRKMGPW